MSEPSIQLTPWQSDKERAATQFEEAKGILEEMEDLPVETQEDLEFAAETLAEIKGKAKELKAMQDRVVKPMNAALAELRSWFKPALDTLDKCEKILKRKIDKAHEEAHARQRAALDAAAAASMEGDTEAAEVALEKAMEQELAPIKGLTMGHTWDYEITDFDAVPREYLLVDDKKVKAVIRAHKGNITIPGIKPVRKTSVASRSR